MNTLINRFALVIALLLGLLAAPTKATPINYTMTDGFSFSVTLPDYIPNLTTSTLKIEASTFTSCRTAFNWVCSYALFTLNFGAPGISQVVLVSSYPIDPLMLPFSNQVVVDTDLGHSGVFESIYGNATLTVTPQPGASPTAVPEPSAALLTFGGLGLIFGFFIVCNTLRTRRQEMAIHAQFETHFRKTSALFVEWLQAGRD